MSTKTSIKRIALVAAAALALGGFSAVSANAAAGTPQIAYTTMYDTTNGYQVVGGQATITLINDTQTVSTITSSGVGTIVSATPLANYGAGFETITSLTSTGFQHNKTTVSAGYVLDQDTVTVVLTSLVAGTQTITVTPLSASGVPGTAVTKTITWTASGTTAASSWSAYLMDSTTGVGAAPTDSTVPLSKDQGTAGSPTQVAIIAAKLKDSNGNAVSGATVSVTLSGPGLITAIAGNSDGTGAPGTPASRVASVTTTSGGYVLVSLSGDGSAGVSTVTFTSGSVSVSRSVTFTGKAASFVATAKTLTYGVGTYGTDDSKTASGILVAAKDSAGGAAANGSFWVTSDNKAVATVSASAHSLTSTSNGETAGSAYVAVTGVSAGTANLTIRNTDPAGTTAPTVTQTIAVTVSSGTADSVSFATDAASYAPGQPGTLSITLKNAAGNPVADGTYTIFDAATPLISNLYVTGNSSGANGPWSSGLVSVTTYGGVASYDFYAPSVGGTLTFSATTLAGTTVSSALTQNVRAKALSAGATINAGGDSSLALDAANAATDAANNAYDEAQNATQAASDALAAVKALAVQVKALIALVTKIKNKVGA